MTPRTFARTYASRTGMTPASGVEALRVETARLLLESRQIGGVVEVAKRPASATTNGCGGRSCGTSASPRVPKRFRAGVACAISACHPAEYRNRFSGR